MVQFYNIQLNKCDVGCIEGMVVMGVVYASILFRYERMEWCFGMIHVGRCCV